MVHLYIVLRCPCHRDIKVKVVHVIAVNACKYMRTSTESHRIVDKAISVRPKIINIANLDKPTKRHRPTGCYAIEGAIDEAVSFR